MNFSPAGGLVGTIIFAIIMVGAFTIFGLEVRRLLRLMFAGRPENRFDHLPQRIGHFVSMVLGQRGVLRDPIPGLAHFFTFWGFIVISLGTLNLWLGAFGGAIPLLGHSYIFSAFVDAFTIAVFVAIVVFSIRRFIVRPKQLDSQLHSWKDGAIILGLILLILAAVAAYDVFLPRASGGTERTLFGDWASGATAGMSVGTAQAWAHVFYWVHVLTVFFFLCYLPVSKHLHLMATPFNVFFKNYGRKAALPIIPNIEEREDYGVKVFEQFTWKQLLDGYACTECGRCNTVCPALATDKPLWPKEIITGVREVMMASDKAPLLPEKLAPLGKLKLLPVSKAAAKEQAEHLPMVGGVIKEESLWACTNCGACVEVCPVNIEHVTKIDDMRRYLVMEESSFPQEVTSLFNNLERNQNPWEQRNDARAEWAAGLGIPTLAEDPEVEVLYWVGCMASFDKRNQQVATALAKVLKAADVKFGILGPEESCTGDPARRIGQEYLWQTLAQQNIEVLNGYGFNTQAAANGASARAASNGHAAANGTTTGSTNGTAGTGVAVPPKHRTIITACPHCFNTIANEYPQLGGNYEIVHHTVFIERLMSEGRLKLPAGFDTRKLTYHDPCFLGRWNDVYDEPRKVLNVINANGVNEMRRHRNKSFCCGGGGGRVWMEEKVGKRINQTRVQEALETGADTLAAGCPFCITMFEDGIKGVEAEERFKVLDIAEILAEALEKAPTASAS
jgi:Fe-S oxidoreductase/nitrate reductase gamma subunit